jgi:hypothetical protein
MRTDLRPPAGGVVARGGGVVVRGGVVVVVRGGVVARSLGPGRSACEAWATRRPRGKE